MDEGGIIGWRTLRIRDRGGLRPNIDIVNESLVLGAIRFGNAGLNAAKTLTEPMALTVGVLRVLTTFSLIHGESSSNESAS